MVKLFYILFKKPYHIFNFHQFQGYYPRVLPKIAKNQLSYSFNCKMSMVNMNVSASAAVLVRPYRN